MKMPPAKILPSACTAIAIDSTVRVRVERISQAGGGIEPGDAVARLSADACREIAAHQNLAVRLHRDCIDSTVRVRVEGGVERAVRVQPGNAVARDRRSAVGRERCKIAADKNLAVRLDDDDVEPRRSRSDRNRRARIARAPPPRRQPAARQRKTVRAGRLSGRESLAQTMWTRGRDWLEPRNTQESSSGEKMFELLTSLRVRNFTDVEAFCDEPTTPTPPYGEGDFFCGKKCARTLTPVKPGGSGSPLLFARSVLPPKERMCPIANARRWYRRC